MLIIHFINVAEGDSALIEYTNGVKIFRILVDTGRYAFTQKEDSSRIYVADYLKKRGIDQLDYLILTHLHGDHAAGLSRFAEDVQIADLYSSYYPKDFSQRIIENPNQDHHVKQLEVDLNMYSRNLQILEKNGTSFHTCLKDETIFDDNKLSVRILTAGLNSVHGQNLIYDHMFLNTPLPEDLRIWAAESRNPNSLRVLISYCGRRIQIDGDYLGMYSEKECLEKCDILKVAHHGDKKSATSKLVQMLQPQYTVFSCSKDYIARKDRPSKTVVDMFRNNGSEIYYTDSFAEEGRPVIKREAVIFQINEQGVINPPFHN